MTQLPTQLSPNDSNFKLQIIVLNIHQILKQYWGYDTFRPMQEDIMNAVLDGKDTLTLLPTGGGKSVCFQVPAIAKDGLCLVVSPLIALIVQCGGPHQGYHYDQ